MSLAAAGGESRRRNRSIEFFRYLFSLFIFIMHFRWYGNFPGEHGQFNGSYIAVEFFFVVSGCFLAAHAEKCRGSASAERLTLRYMCGRFARILPAYWLSMLIFLTVQALCQGPSSPMDAALHAGSALLNGWTDALLLQIFRRPSAIDYYTWYISAMLWGAMPVYYLLLKCRRLFMRVLAPLAVVLGCCHFALFVGNVDISAGWEGLLRGVMGISAGCWVHDIHQHLLRSGRRLPAPLMTALEIGLTAGVAGAMYHIRREAWDCLLLLPIAAMVLVFLLGQGRLSRWLDRRWSEYLGAISMPVYLNQNSVITAGASLVPDAPFWPFALLLFAALTIAAMLLHAGLTRLPKKIRHETVEAKR